MTGKDGSTKHLRSVGDVARLTGVTVRALHHYDAIGLLVAKRSAKGYRLYDDAAVARLHEIIVGRQLGLSLDELKAQLDDPSHDRIEALRAHRRRLHERLEDTQSMIAAIDRALAQRRGVPMTDADIQEIFDGFDPSEHEAEAKERWGDTEAFAESARRTKSYGKEEWRAIKDEMEAIDARFIALMEAGVSPSSEQAREVAEAHRQHIDRWFYPVPPRCTAASHRPTSTTRASRRATRTRRRDWRST